MTWRKHRIAQCSAPRPLWKLIIGHNLQFDGVYVHLFLDFLNERSLTGIKAAHNSASELSIWWSRGSPSLCKIKKNDKLS